LADRLRKAADENRSAVVAGSAILGETRPGSHARSKPMHPTQLNPIRSTLAAMVLAAAGFYSVQASAAGKIDCEMKFSVTGWAAIYKHAEGSGTISCSNGKSYSVDIVAVGGGLTAGKYRIEHGTGKFSEVYDTTELFGSYAQGEANAGVVRSGIAQVMTKGNVSLALAGTGEGVNLGISFGKFTIRKVK
jgi:hypothetical protein